MFNNKYRYLYALILSGYSFGNSVVSSIYAHYNIKSPWYDALLVFVLITLFVWEGNRLLIQALKNTLANAKPVRQLIIHFVSGAILSSIISILVLYFVGEVLAGVPAADLRMPAILTFTYATRINLFLHILNAVFFFANQYKSKQLEAEELKRINTQAQLQVIKHQINPHFLFNNLNVLSSMVLQENPDSNKFIEEFAKVYRHILNSHDQELIPLIDELEFVKPYLFLLRKRFPDGIFIEIDVPPAFGNYYVVPVSLQMLIENAIKHNVVSKSKPLTVTIQISGGNKVLVSNNLQLKTSHEESKKIGLENIRKRYEIITGLSIEIEKTTSLFSVSIPLIQL